MTPEQILRAGGRVTGKLLLRLFNVNIEMEDEEFNDLIEYLFQI